MGFNWDSVFYWKMLNATNFQHVPVICQPFLEKGVDAWKSVSERRSVDIILAVMLARKGKSFVKLRPPRPFRSLFCREKKTPWRWGNTSLL